MTAFAPLRRERVDERERARHRAHRTVETQLAQHRDAVEHAGGQRVVGAEHPERDREIQSRARLADVAGREVDGDARSAATRRPDDRTAARTRSRDSRTAASGRPTT